MSDAESPTETLEKKPLLKAVLDYTFRWFERVIVPLIIAGVIGGCNVWKESHDTGAIWQHSANWAHKSDITNAVNGITNKESK